MLISTNLNQSATECKIYRNRCIIFFSCTFYKMFDLDAEKYKHFINNCQFMFRTWQIMQIRMSEFFTGSTSYIGTVQSSTTCQFHVSELIEIA